MHYFHRQYSTLYGSVRILRSIVEGEGGITMRYVKRQVASVTCLRGGVAGAVTGEADLLAGRRPGGAQQRQKRCGEQRGACRRGVGDSKGLYLTKICFVEEGGQRSIGFT